MTSDEILFAEDTDEPEQQERHCWKVLVVDDEPEVHAVTKLALSDVQFQGRCIEFLSAYSGKEAQVLCQQHNDIAVILLDVVMESDDAGLRVARYVRDELHNRFTRIILRTGQPGQAPEKDIILNYDINDYKSKTELTAQKLFTVIISALRSYRDIVAIEENRQGLEKIIQASSDLFCMQSLEAFIEGIMQQLTSLLGGSPDALYLTSAVAGPKPINDLASGQFYVFFGQGEYGNFHGKKLEEVISGEHLQACQQALRKQQVVYSNNAVVAYCQGRHQPGSLLYLTGLPRALSATDKRLIEIFAENVQNAFDNVLMNKEYRDTQQELLERLGAALEGQYDGGHHYHRLVRICTLLAKDYGLGAMEIERLTLALPLHDIGKLRVPQDILQKESTLTDDELSHARRHAQMGYDILKDSQRPIIQTAAMLARDHHEKWDGSGYPRGLKGEEIDIKCRIIALVDTYDVLRNNHGYKKALPAAEAVKVINAESGRHFDPTLVDIFNRHLPEIERIIGG